MYATDTFRLQSYNGEAHEVKGVSPARPALRWAKGEGREAYRVCSNSPLTRVI